MKEGGTKMLVLARLRLRSAVRRFILPPKVQPGDPTTTPCPCCGEPIQIDDTVVVHIIKAGESKNKNMHWKALPGGFEEVAACGLPHCSSYSSLHDAVFKGIKEGCAKLDFLKK